MSSLRAKTPAAHAPLKSPYQNGCAGIKERHNPHLSAHYRCVDMGNQDHLPTKPFKTLVSTESAESAVSDHAETYQTHLQSAAGAAKTERLALKSQRI